MDKEKFWSNVNIKGPNDCWRWKAGHFSQGYGRFKVDGLQKRAHRVSWELTNGPISEEKLCLHRCDNKLCVNPNHLYIGNQSDNMCDMVERNSTFKNNCRIARSKFYEGEIWLIRKLKIPSRKYGINRKYKISARTVAKMFKTGHSTILRIWDSDKYPCREGYLC